MIDGAIGVGFVGAAGAFTYFMWNMDNSSMIRGVLMPLARDVGLDGAGPEAVMSICDPSDVQTVANVLRLRVLARDWSEVVNTLNQTKGK